MTDKIDKIEISPADIRHKEFSGSMFGYNKAEIREYLDMLAEHLEDLYNQRTSNVKEPAVNVYEDRSQTQFALEQMQKREELIAKTLIQAENTRNDIIRTAKQEAENIIREAELAAKKAIDETKNYINMLKHDFVNVKENRRMFISTAHAQCRVMMERLEADPLFNKTKEAEVDKGFDAASEIKLGSGVVNSENGGDE